MRGWRSARRCRRAWERTTPPPRPRPRWPRRSWPRADAPRSVRASRASDNLLRARLGVHRAGVRVHERAPGARLVGGRPRSDALEGERPAEHDLFAQRAAPAQVVVEALEGAVGVAVVEQHAPEERERRVRLRRARVAVQQHAVELARLRVVARLQGGVGLAEDRGRVGVALDGGRRCRDCGGSHVGRDARKGRGMRGATEGRGHGDRHRSRSHDGRRGSRNRRGLGGLFGDDVRRRGRLGDCGLRHGGDPAASWRHAARSSSPPGPRATGVASGLAAQGRTTARTSGHRAAAAARPVIVTMAAATATKRRYRMAYDALRRPAQSLEREGAGHRGEQSRHVGLGLGALVVEAEVVAGAPLEAAHGALLRHVEARGEAALRPTARRRSRARAGPRGAGPRATRLPLRGQGAARRGCRGCRGSRQARGPRRCGAARPPLRGEGGCGRC